MSIAECPRCGYSRGSNTEANPHLAEEKSTVVQTQPKDVPTLQAELRRIEDSISSFEKSISRLIEVKCLVLRQINTTQAATRRLPSELLSLIFQIVRPSIDFDSHYLNLGTEYTNTFHAEESVLYVLTAVCHHWRQVALSTSQLWTTVRLKVDPDYAYHSVHQKISLLDLHVQNARDTPLSIELDLAPLPFEVSRDLGNPDFEMHYHNILRLRKGCLERLELLQSAVFVEKAPMIQHLLLLRPPSEWFPLINENLSQCKSVTVLEPRLRMIEHEDDTPFDDILDLTRLPCLQHVQLIFFFHRILITETIKTLHLRDMRPSLCVQLLLRCRNVVNFEVVNSHPESQTIIEVKEPVLFPDLEHFRWSNADLLADGSLGPDLLRHIQLPSLRSLVWADDDDGVSEQDSSNEDPRDRFFSQLPPSLSSLTLVKMCYNPQNGAIERILPCVSHVTELHFVECPAMTITTAVKAIGRPLPAQEHRSRSPDSVIRVLPNLRKLTITSSALGIEDLQFQEIVGMLEALHAVTVRERRERFHLHINVITDWDDSDEQVLGRLRTLVRDGINLEIRIDSCVLDLGV